jgi:hypothetical protein
MEYAIGALVCVLASVYASLWAALLVPTCDNGMHLWLYALWDRLGTPVAAPIWIWSMFVLQGDDGWGYGSAFVIAAIVLGFLLAGIAQGAHDGDADEIPSGRLITNVAHTFFGCGVLFNFATTRCGSPLWSADTGGRARFPILVYLIGLVTATAAHYFANSMDAYQAWVDREHPDVPRVFAEALSCRGKSAEPVDLCPKIS